MTKDEAMGLTGMLVGAGHGGWNDEGVDLCVAEMMTWDEMDAAKLAIGTLIHTWDGEWRPTIAQIYAAYQAQRKRLHEDDVPQIGPEPVVARDRGWEIAKAAYRRAYGREMGEPLPEPVSELASKAADFIREVNRPYHDAQGRLFWTARYTDVLEGFGRDHLRTGVGLEALKPHLVWERNGRLALPTVVDVQLPTQAAPLRYTPRTTPSAPDVAAPAPNPPQGTTDPDPGISVADAAAQVAQNLAEADGSPAD